MIKKKYLFTFLVFQMVLLFTACNKKTNESTSISPTANIELTDAPILTPITLPTSTPTSIPTLDPTLAPTSALTSDPTLTPTSVLTSDSTLTPTSVPSPSSSPNDSDVENNEVHLRDVAEQLDSIYGDFDEITYAYITKYQETNRSVMIQPIEWLTPWSEQDIPRIQELLDQGKIPEGEEIWNYEYYIYTGDKECISYPLSDKITIVLRENASTWKYFEVADLAAISDNLILDIWIKDGHICAILEPYTP